jgi:dihydropteroate synthase
MPLWRVQDTPHDLAARGMVMGVLNVTPDSFSDGGRFFDPAQAVKHGLEMIAEGADILDIGGESTRPGAQPVDEAEELRRVIPVIAALRRETRSLLSIDTMKPAVARAALEAGADILNDVTGFRDPAMIQAAVGSRAGLIVMHMQGDPQTMQSHPVYADVVAEVAAFFEERLRTLTDARIAIDRIALTLNAAVPGIDDATFQKIALEVKKSCPLSKALREFSTTPPPRIRSLSSRRL